MQFQAGIFVEYRFILKYALETDSCFQWKTFLVILRESGLIKMALLLDGSWANEFDTK